LYSVETSIPNLKVTAKINGKSATQMKSATKADSVSEPQHFLCEVCFTFDSTKCSSLPTALL